MLANVFRYPNGADTNLTKQSFVLFAKFLGVIQPKPFFYQHVIFARLGRHRRQIFTITAVGAKPLSLAVRPIRDAIGIGLIHDAMGFVVYMFRRLDEGLITVDGIGRYTRPIKIIPFRQFDRAIPGASTSGNGIRNERLLFFLAACSASQTGFPRFSYSINFLTLNIKHLFVIVSFSQMVQWVAVVDGIYFNAS